MIHRLGRSLLAAAAIVLSANFRVDAGHVTLITHGYNSDTDGWVKGLGEAISQYPRRLRQYAGEVTMYRVAFDSQGAPKAVRLSGPPPDQNPSGDILLLLDWTRTPGPSSGATSAAPR